MNNIFNTLLNNIQTETCCFCNNNGHNIIKCISLEKIYNQVKNNQDLKAELYLNVCNILIVRREFDKLHSILKKFERLD